MAGNIISFALEGIFLVLVILFFARQKAPALTVVGAIQAALLAVMHALTLYASETFAFAYAIVAIWNILCGASAITVYRGDFRNIYLRMSKLRKKTANCSLSDEERRESINAIVTACQTMAKSRTGALIVVVRNKIDEYIVNSGIRLDAVISAPLLESIFNTRCPMHDGAVIVMENRIAAAGAFLPLSKNESLSKELGTRHRAGIGVTETEGNDILSIIISEENGIISTAHNGVLRRYLTPERLFDTLYDPYLKGALGRRAKRVVAPRR